MGGGDRGRDRAELPAGGRGDRGDDRRADDRGHPGRHRRVRGGGDRGARRRSAPAPARRWPRRWSRTPPRPRTRWSVGGVGLVTPAPGYFGRLRLARAPAAAAAGGAAVAGRAGGRGDPASQRGRHRRRRGAPAARGRVWTSGSDGRGRRRLHRRLGRAGAPRPVPSWSPSRRNLGPRCGGAPGAGRGRRAATRPAWSTSTRTASTSPRSWSCWPRRCWPGGPTTWSAPGSPAGPGGCGRTGTAGNRLLTRWVRWMTRRRDLTDGQSGYRAFSPGGGRRGRDRARLQLRPGAHPRPARQGLRVRRGADHATRSAPPAPSFVRLGTYLRKVVPAVHQELNAG